MRAPRLLIVDDEPTIRMLVRLTFERQGFDVLEAADGASAIDIVLGEQPDLILLDNALPQMTGLELARLFDETIPVLLLTGLAPEIDSADWPPSIKGFVEKPFIPALLVERVRTTLEASERGPQASAA